MWIERLRGLFRYPSPYDGDHIYDPLFYIDARGVKWMESPEAMRGFNRKFMLYLGGGFAILLSLFLYLVAPPPPEPDDILGLLVLATVVIWLLGLISDEVALIFAVSSMQPLKTSGALEFIRATPVSPVRLLVARYRIALVYTWRVLWLTLIVRYVLVILWLPVVVYGVFQLVIVFRSDPIENTVLITGVVTAYLGVSYILIREPLWRCRIMTAIGLKAAIERESYIASYLWAGWHQSLFWVGRLFLFAIGVYGVVIGETMILAVGIWTMDALVRWNAVYIAAILAVPLTVVSVVFPVWVYCEVILLNRDWYSGSTDDILRVRVHRLLEPDE